MEKLNSLEDLRITAVAVCMRGFGYSTYNSKVTKVEDLATDIAEFMRKVFPNKKFYVAG